MKEGFTVVKFMAYGVNDRMLDAIQNAEKRCKAVRDRVGNKMDIMLECHGHPSQSLALDPVQRLHKYRPLGIEEPLFAENIDTMAEL